MVVVRIIILSSGGDPVQNCLCGPPDITVCGK